MDGYRLGKVLSISVEPKALQLNGFEFQLPNQIPIMSGLLIELSDLRHRAVPGHNRSLNGFARRVFSIRTLKVDAESVTEIGAEQLDSEDMIVRILRRNMHVGA